MHLMILLLCSLALVADELPGTRYAVLPAGTVLHAGPSVDHAGVLTLAGDTVVRTEDASGEFARVYVPQGFPVYLHGEFVDVDEDLQRVTVTGDRVNLRLLPAALGLPPVGKVAAGTQLIMLDLESGWVRALAPVAVPLYARGSQFGPPTDNSPTRWTAAVGARELGRQRALAAHRATDPSWQAADRLSTELGTLEAVVLAQLDDAGLAAREQSLSGMLARADRADAKRRIQAMLDAAKVEAAGRSQTRERLAELARQQARDAEALVREARALDMGLRFLGRGEALVVEGVVARRASEQHEAVVYTIQDASGRQYKLSVAPDIAQLEPLLGRKVVLEGRSIPLVNVEGMVLVVDKVAKVHPR